MFEIYKKFIKGLAIFSLTLLIAGATHYGVQNLSGDPLEASILDGVNPTDIDGVEFVSPKGTAFPVNGVVTINSVYVDVSGGDSGNVSGADLENSFISFIEGDTAAPSGTIFSGNQIIVPDGAFSPFTVDVSVPGTSVEADPELRIEPIQCSDLQTSVIRGYGTGFEGIDASDLPEAATTITAGGFDFTPQPPVTPGDPEVMIENIILSYPETDVDGARTFVIHIDFVPDISADPLNGIAERAKIVANNGDGDYEILVKNAGADYPQQTAGNFAYVFNYLLGINSPFTAYFDVSDPNVVHLISRELGTHANAYNCSIDGAEVTGCFSDGASGTVSVLTTPLTLDNEITQGDSSLVNARNSAGIIEWISSHPSVLEVSTLSEASQSDDATVDFQDELLDISPDLPVYDEGNASYNITDCEKDYDDDDNYIDGTETCTVQVTLPIEYEIDGIDYTANVSIEDEVVPVTLQGSKLTGQLIGTGTYTSSSGLSINLTGQVSGAVAGSISGQYSGTVNGTITAPITATGTKAGQDGEISNTDFSVDGFTVSTITENTLTDVPGSFTNTIKKIENDFSQFAILTAKRPGTSLLTAIDTNGCIASMEVVVPAMKVILQMVGRNPGDVFEVGDNVQINAFKGSASGEVDEYQNITSQSGIEWKSSNSNVATIDQTGLLTALAPGTTNITATFDTGEAEIGTIESVPMTVTVNKITGLRITYDEATQAKLPGDIVNQAHESVMIAIHSPEVAGQTLTVEGQTIDLVLPPGTYENDLQKIEAILNGDPLDPVTYPGLIADLEAIVNPDLTAPDDTLVRVTTVDGYPGMLTLQPLHQTENADGNDDPEANENGIIDIQTTALADDLTVLPTYSDTVPLPTSESYSLLVVAKYDNGATKLLPPTEFTWVNTPVNYLEQASLDTGVIRMGEIPGVSTVVARFENADGSVIASNYLTVSVEQGPVIEYVRRIGSGSITKGQRVNLKAKISDVNTIDDITSIEISLVKSNFNTFTQINSDPNAIWYTAIPFLSEVEVLSEGGGTTTTTTTTEGGEGESEGESGTTTTTTTEEPTSSALDYGIFQIPFEVPTDQNLVDGSYNLVISVTDAMNHTLDYVYPMRIGEIGEGDVNGDGNTNMVDVILAFKIASGMIVPTPAQLEAANVDGVGGVTMVDVILLFNTVKNS
jgi:hypothetical protein